MRTALNDKVFVPVIIGLSIAVPLIVAVLLYMPKAGIVPGVGFNIYIFPFINACLNSTVTVLLLAGLYFIKTKQRERHKWTMISAFTLSVLFLVSYVIYHFLQTKRIEFLGGAPMVYVYRFILATHILLSTAIVPLALFSIYRGINNQFDKHRKIAKWTMPIWLYVSVTGVLVYILISPYYN